MALREHTRRKKIYGKNRRKPKTVNQGSERYVKIYSFRPQPSFGIVED